MLKPSYEQNWFGNRRYFIGDQEVDYRHYCVYLERYIDWMTGREEEE